MYISNMTGMKSIYILIIALLSMMGCSEDFLDLEPTDKISPDAIFSRPAGIESLMAHLYATAPIEDCNSVSTFGFSWNSPWPNQAGWYPFIMTDDAVGSQHQGIIGWAGIMEPLFITAWRVMQSRE